MKRNCDCKYAGLVVACEGSDFFLHEQDLFGRVYFLQFHFDDFDVAGLDVATDESGFNREFPMSAIDEHQQLDSLRTPMVEQCVEGSASRAPGIKHVIAHDDVHILDIRT